MAVLAGADRSVAHEVAVRIRRGVVELSDRTGGPHVEISVGVACFPEDGRDKDALVEMADRALYLAKPEGRSAAGRESPADPYLRALDETALALLDGHDSTVLLETILARATALLGTPHGYIYLAEPDGSLAISHGSGMFAQLLGRRISVDQGLVGHVYRTGAPLVVADYDTYAERVPDFETGDARLGRRRPAGLRRHDGRRDRPRVGNARSDVRPARDARPGALRPARVDRPRQFAPVRCRPARRAPRPDRPASRTASC